MSITTVPVGLLDFEVYLPERFVTSAEIAELTRIPEPVIREKFGVTRKPVGGPEDHCVAMAVKAARRLLERTGVRPDEIDLIIYPGEEWKEYLLWTGGIKIQKELGALRCWSFDLPYRCAAASLALKVAKDLMQVNPDLQTVLIAGGNTNAYAVNYQDPNSSFMFDMGPSGHAALLKRGVERNQILGSGIHTEPLLVDDVIVPLGGTRVPITPENAGKGQYLEITDPEHMKSELGARSFPAFIRACDLALADSGLDRRDIGFFGMIHVKRSAHDAIVAELGLRPDQAVYLQDYGHLGHTDPYLCLKLGLESGQLKPGMNALLLGAGTGYAFTASVIRWG
ncbi:MAG TPA: 3-oxoacyl-ACP synthase [Symbiobacteriaceae bacterium]|jgi:3-oxoacyl-[acyl-carrier-protein] synthase-3